MSTYASDGSNPSKMAILSMGHLSISQNLYESKDNTPGSLTRLIIEFQAHDLSRDCLVRLAVCYLCSRTNSVILNNDPHLKYPFWMDLYRAPAITCKVIAC